VFALANDLLFPIVIATTLLLSAAVVELGRLFRWSAGILAGLILYDLGWAYFFEPDPEGPWFTFTSMPMVAPGAAVLAIALAVAGARLAWVWLRSRSRRTSPPPGETAAP
jgi:hypothetical protein